MKTKLLYTIILMSFLYVTGCSENDDDNQIVPPDPIEINTERIETFTFTSNGVSTNGKIFLPETYETNDNLPTIYLIDYQEQHFEVATDEFDRVVDAVKDIDDFDALVVTLEEHLNVDTNPEVFLEHYDVFKNMSSFVDSEYTNNTSRTFLGRGSEAGIVLMALFMEDTESSVFDNFIATDSPTSFNSAIIQLVNNDDFPQKVSDKKLHFSFSESNNQNVCNQLIDKINEAQYPWLQFESREYQSDFPTTYPTAFSAGINYIFND